jgi:hypothetical protein
MDDRTLRELLQEVMADLDRRMQAPRRRLPHLVGPALLAASLGLAGCTGRSIGSGEDAAHTVRYTEEDAGPEMDAAYQAPFDAAPDADVSDAGDDGGSIPVAASAR